MVILSLLREREINSRVNFHRRIPRLLEESFNKGNYEDEYLTMNTTAVTSTIAVDISNNGVYLASSHGDHTVKIFIYATGKQIRNFRGHLRTPWTVKFNPKDINIVASGCLGCEARIWNISLDICLNVVKYEFSIITVSFHPSGELLAVASGQMLRLWNWRKVIRSTSSMLSPLALKNLQEQDTKYRSFDCYTRAIMNERSIRAVIFHPNGNFLFVAAPYLRREEKRSISSVGLTPCRLYCVNYYDLFDDLPKRLLDLQSQPVILSEMHVYSDGGIDVSKDGKCLVVCGMLLKPQIDRAVAHHTGTIIQSSNSDFDVVAKDRISFNQNRLPPPPLQSGPTLLCGSHPLFPPLPVDGYSMLFAPPSNVSSSSETSQTSQITSCQSVFQPSMLTSGTLNGKAIIKQQSRSYLNHSYEHERPLETNFIIKETRFTSSPDPTPIPITSARAITNQPAGYVSKEYICVFNLQEAVLDDDIGSCSPLQRSSSPFHQSSSKNQLFETPSQNHINPVNSNALVSVPLSLNTLSSPLMSIRSVLQQRQPERDSSRIRTPRAVAYDDDISDDNDFIECNINSLQMIHVKLVHYRELSSSLMKAIVSTKFSSTGDFIVLGYGVRNTFKEVTDHPYKRVACEILEAHSYGLRTVSVFSHNDDEVNVSLFHPLPGCGLVYGTKTGKLRVFNRVNKKI